jgi:hypothetical protein
LNFVGDRELAEQLERMRQEFLGRTAEEYRDSEYYRRKLKEGLRSLADTARDMAQSGSQGLVEQFGQMGKRRFHLSQVQANADADEGKDDADESSIAHTPFNMGAGDDQAHDAIPDLAVASA